MNHTVDNFILTLKGNSLLTAAQRKGLGTLNFTHIGLGDVAWNPDSSATRLKNERIREPIKDDDVEDQGGGQLRIIGRFNDETSFKVQETGLYQDDNLVAISSNYTPNIEFEVFPQGIAGINVEHTQDTSNAHYITEIENGKFKTTKFIDGQLETFFSPINNQVKISDNILHIEDLSILPDNFVVRVIGSVSRNAVTKHSWMTYISEVFFQIGQTPVEHITVNSQPLNKTYVDLTPLHNAISRTERMHCIQLANNFINTTNDLLYRLNKEQQDQSDRLINLVKLWRDHLTIQKKHKIARDYNSHSITPALERYITNNKEFLKNISKNETYFHNISIELQNFIRNIKQQYDSNAQSNSNDSKLLTNLLSYWQNTNLINNNLVEQL